MDCNIIDWNFIIDSSEKYNNLLILILTLVTTVLTFLMLGIGMRDFINKRGHNIKASYSMIKFPHIGWFMSDILLHNKKNKPEAITAIHLQIGYNIFVKIVDFSESPMIILANEAKNIKVDHANGYVLGNCGVNMLSLIGEKGTKTRMLLTSPDGIIKVNPIKYSINKVHSGNSLHPIFHTIKKYSFKEKDGNIYNGKILYICELKLNGHITKIHVYDSGSVYILSRDYPTAQISGNFSEMSKKQIKDNVKNNIKSIYPNEKIQNFEIWKTTFPYSEELKRTIHPEVINSRLRLWRVLFFYKLTSFIENIKKGFKVWKTYRSLKKIKK